MKQLLITIVAVVLLGCGPSTPNTSIWEASANGNIEAVKQHIAAGTDLNANQNAPVSFTPLNLAVRKGQSEIVKLLLDAGADVNAKSETLKTTPLHSAIWNLDSEIAKFLIDKGADVNAMDEYGMTCLHYAELNIQNAELLIANGANVNAKRELNGNTPLDIAIEDAESEIADLLRKHGAKTGEELKAEGK